eukprot:gene19592-23434_t
MFRSVICVALFAAVAVSAFEDIELANTPNALEEANARGIFDSWMSKMEKSYESAEEKESRFQVFHMNMRFVSEHNTNEQNTHKVGLNGLADLNVDEYRKLLGFQKVEKTSTTDFMYADTAPADSVDWRTKEAVTPVKNQAQCGSCWSFSATGAIEGINAIKTGKLVSVSEQELVSCDKVDSGCQGGLMDNAFDWVVQNGGLNTEEAYPYVSGSGNVPACDSSKASVDAVTIDGHEDVPKDSDSAMMKALTNQPVSVAIEADQQAFQLYTSGIFSAPCGTQLDHGVLAVGYGSGYWIVKNSWGASWGDKGYIKMANGVSGAGHDHPVCDVSAGTCGDSSGNTVSISKKTKAAKVDFIDRVVSKEVKNIFGL